MRKCHLFVVAFLQIGLVNCLIDPVTIGVGSAVSFLSVFVYNHWNKCTDYECCTSDWIPINTRDLERQFKTSLHGQQIAATTVLRALTGYKNTEEPPKALAMSFHGLPGSGKNFVTNMIAKAFFKKGTDSSYYHFFNGRSFAPLESLLEQYKLYAQGICLNAKTNYDWITGKNTMRDTIVSSLLECERSMFVFDEVDMMPVGLLNVLVPFIDYTKRTGVTHQGKHTYVTTNKAIFIFLSNTGSKHIMDQMLKFWESGKNRNSMKLADFENLIALGAFNEKGGFQKSDAIRTSLIDYYVPFMPMEEFHVKRCMEDAFRSRASPTKSMEDEVLSVITWGPPPHNIYARSGCKKIEQKVISVVYQNMHGD